MNRLIYLVATILMLTCASAYAQTKQTLTYDTVGRVSTVTYMQGTQVVKISYEYDGRSNLISSRTEVTTDVHDDESNSALILTLKPNPTSSEVMIEVGGEPGTATEISVVHMSGRVMIKNIVIADDSGIARLQFNSRDEGLASGSYTVVAVNGGMKHGASLVIDR